MADDVYRCRWCHFWVGPDHVCPVGPRKVAKAASVVLVALLLGGCASQLAMYDAAKVAAAQSASSVADRKLELDKWQLCQAQSIGAVMRAVGADPVEWRRWAAFCHWPLEAPVKEPE